MLRIVSVAGSLIVAAAIAVAPALAAPRFEYLRPEVDTGTQTQTQTLYVLNLNPAIDVFTPGRTLPRLVITGGLATPGQIAVDSNGKRYAANFGTSPSYVGSITEYDRGHTAPTHIYGAGTAKTGVAVDSAGNVFASEFYGNDIAAFHPGQPQPYAHLGGVFEPTYLEYGAGHLFAATGSHQIARYTSATSPDLTLTLVAPGNLPAGAITYGGPFAVGPDGAVYAGGYVVAADLGYEEFFNVFAPGSSTPYAAGIVATGNNADQPALTAFASGVLYVANQIDSVREYAVRPSGIALLRTITNGVAKPGSLAIDAANHLYVANEQGNSVTVYRPGATSPAQTLSVAGPQQLLIAR